MSAVVIGLGFSAIYPITIALLSHKFGSAATRLGSVMFVLAGFGGAGVPWLVGLFSTEMSSLQLALIVPAAGCAAMLVIYLMNWQGAL
jgi:fucose permease